MDDYESLNHPTWTCSDRVVFISRNLRGVALGVVLLEQLHLALSGRIATAACWRFPSLPGTPIP